MKSYAVKEMFLTIQGEGVNAGRVAVFCRFAGCNLWSGREEDRSSAVCRFCDTDFVGTDGDGGGRFTSANDLVRAVLNLWPANGPNPFVVFTGGEPLLQLDDRLIDALCKIGFEIAVETNGTIPVPSCVDWVCVSPKAGSDLKVRRGDELKLVYPQPGIDPAIFLSPEFSFRHFWVQPMDGPDKAENTRLAIQYCLRHPKWRLSVQIHKILGVR